MLNTGTGFVQNFKFLNALVFRYFLKLSEFCSIDFVHFLQNKVLWNSLKLFFKLVQREHLVQSFSPWISWYTALKTLENSLNFTNPNKAVQDLNVMRREMAMGI